VLGCVAKLATRNILLQSLFGDISLERFFLTSLRRIQKKFVGRANRPSNLCAISPCRQTDACFHIVTESVWLKAINCKVERIPTETPEFFLQQTGVPAVPLPIVLICRQ
jgi:hypothetical protein